MSKDELLDLVNEDDEVVGEVWKSEAHKNPSKIHREVAMIVLTKRGETLLQKRSAKKKHDPGVWQIASAGHVEKGEVPKKAAERELLEEMGIRTKLKFIRKFSNKYKKESRIFYLYYSLLPKRVKVKFNPEEVDEVKWVKLDDVDEFFGEDMTFAQRASVEILKDSIKIIASSKR